MARKIIILDRTGLPSDQNYRVAMWFDVAAARQTFHANVSAASVVKGITAPELAAIQSGAVIEEVIEVPAQAGVGQAALLAALVTRYNQRQAEVTARNHWARYGTSWDGATWTPVTVA